MIRHHHDLTIASYYSLAEVSLKEAKEADLLEIRSPVPGGIYHSRQLLWKGYLAKDQQPETFFRSKKEKKSIQKNQQFFEKSGYEIKTITVDNQLYQEFVELYQQTVGKKYRLTQVDYEELVKGRLATNRAVYCAGLFKENHLESGLLFAPKGKEISVLLGAKKRFAKIPGGIGGLLEHELLRFCHKNSFSLITHGRGDNPAGITSTSGLFEFKARHGFSAFPTGYWVTSFIVNFDKLPADLVFVSVKGNQLLYKVISHEDPTHTRKKYCTREITTVEVITPQQALRATSKFLKGLTQ